MSKRIQIIRETSGVNTESYTVPRHQVDKSGGGGTGGASKHVSAPKVPMCGGHPKLQDIRRQCKQTGRLWEDPDFPAVTKSVYPSTPYRKMEWARPRELCSNPVLFSGGASRFDVQQGELGDCWVLAAVASLSMNAELFNNVVPNDQGFEDDYCGAFLFRFWQFGEWKDVLVDDRLPVERKKLMFMHSTDGNEFWSALLEKAYAKINKSYEALIGGSQAEAMEDFTGGLCEVVNLSGDQPPKNLFSQIQNCLRMSSLIGCSIDAEEDDIEGKLPNGLIVGHAYSVTDSKEVDYHGSKVQLIRVRNPWGDDSEWNGDWCDESPQWKDYTVTQRKNMGIVFDDDGEFWMSFQDFVANFTKLEICHLGPESLNSPHMNSNRKKKSRWEMVIHNGAWQRNINAGGCRNFIESFWTNPQYQLDVVDPDDTDDEDKGTLIIGLMQKDMRQRKLDFWTIGYSIYRLPAKTSGTMDKRFFMVNKMADKSPQYINQREIVGRHSLPPGRYVIIPTTFKSNEDAEFILRIFSEKPYGSNEMDLKNEIKPIAIKIPIQEKNEEEQRLEVLKTVFLQTSGPRESINATQLREILNSSLRKDIKVFKGFNVEVCRSMIALMDSKELSGRMELDEFIALWTHLVIWKKVFLEHDKDGNGTFDAFELREALNDSGFRVSNRVFTALSNRYTDPDNGVVAFEDFILLITRLKKAFEVFKVSSKMNDRGLFAEEEFLLSALYL